MISQTSVSYPDILTALERGATLLTGSKRLTGIVRDTFDQDATNKSLEAWPSPDILPWTAWLQRLWEEAIVSGISPPSPCLLTPLQERFLWEEIITDSTAKQPLLHMGGTVRYALEAWQWIHAWQLPWEDSAAFHYNSDSLAFSGWATKFESLCKEKGWLSSSQLASTLQNSLQIRPWFSPKEILLFGFDELTPQQCSLLHPLIASGCNVQWIFLADKPSRTRRIECDTLYQETDTMARWVRQCLEEHPEVRIGVVIPELAANRETVRHALDEILAPHTQLPGQQSLPRPYNISLGLPLGSYPIIHTALSLLNLLKPLIELKEIGQLLLSPFILGWQQEASARSLLDVRLRKAGESEVSLQTIRYYASQIDQPHACPILVNCLKDWECLAQAHLGKYGVEKYPAGQWPRHFAALLNAMGWACGRSLSSDEYQAVEAWHALLRHFSTLDPMLPPLPAFRAATYLRRMTSEQTFQPKSSAVTVQILGVFEASGLQFDRLWIMGLHDGIWPAAPRPNPFIPLYLQKEAGLPRSSEARELALSRTLTARLLNSADEVVVSAPLRHNDEALRPSPLIVHLPKEDITAHYYWSGMPWKNEVHRSARLSKIDNDFPPPVQDESISGGSQVFKLQAACPFRAFAEIRLGARGEEQVSIGLNAMTRGTLIHRILEKTWAALDTHQRLIDLDTPSLQTLVQQKTHAAIDEIAHRYPQTLRGRFRQLESQRLIQHVLQWLALEKQRLPFQIFEKEANYQAQAGGIRVRIKVDRIDTLADGQQLLIDYKTGPVTPAEWFGERPSDPQLPLYSIAVPDENNASLAGLVFAQISASKVAFSGVTANTKILPGVKSFEALKQTKEKATWTQVLEEWNSILDTLGAEFKRGNAKVDPKKYPDTCLYCQLTPLCRINEQRDLGSINQGPTS